MTYRGKHRKTSAASRHIARVAVAGMAVGAPLAIAATPAQAESGTNWDAVAQCESSGNWSTNTGNGFSGGLQFTPSTWKAYGGQGSAQNASRDEQIKVAERVKDGQGMGAWPNCGKKGGSSASHKGTNTEGKKTTKSAPKKAQKQVEKSSKKAAPKKAAPKVAIGTSNPNGDYTVKAGDTLGKIAKESNVQGGYAKLQQLNDKYIPNADIIVVGQKIATK